ncbi:MAG: PRC-barrel domain-containing protein [Spartobacteria bacterium]
MKTLVFAFCAAALLPCHADAPGNRWDEIVGKRVYNRKGESLGHVSGAAVDIENGRYVGMLVSFGGVLSIGETTKALPPSVLVDDGKPGTLYLDMEKEKFQNAPTFEMSDKVGPPDPKTVAEVYRFYGKAPYFENGGEPLGYIKLSSDLFRMPVENLQGVGLGYVLGLRNLNRMTGRIQGVLIQPYDTTKPVKEVRPQSLRYNLKHDGFELNDHEQLFVNAPRFNVVASGNIREDAPDRPGTPQAPLVQGASAKDKETTLRIDKLISADKRLSHYGRNVEVATLNGKTTIRGRATTQENKNRVLSYAASVAGAGNVIDRIEVKPMTEAEKQIDR